MINIGAPAGGMSTAVRAFVRSALYEGHSVLGIRDGIDGLLQDKVGQISDAFQRVRKFVLSRLVIG